jgi:large subunit ribosomal protein L17
MRHLKKTKKFKRTPEERKRLKIDLCSALIKEKKIVTFETRAKWFRSYVERLITLVKRAGDDKKLAFTKVRPLLSEDVARILIEEVAPKMKERNGGYTAIYKMQNDFGGENKCLVTFVE